MHYEAKKLTLKNGQTVILRPLEPADGAAMLDFLKTVSGETPFMIRYPDEVTFTLAQEEQILGQRLEDPFLVDLAVFTEEGSLIANCTLHRVTALDRMAHRAEMSIAVLKSFWHMGLGSQLVERAIQAAREMPGVELLMLTTMGKNTRARALYERLGFVQTGELPRAFRYRDGSYDSEILMALPL